MGSTTSEGSKRAGPKPAQARGGRAEGSGKGKRQEREGGREAPSLLEEGERIKLSMEELHAVPFPVVSLVRFAQEAL